MIGIGTRDEGRHCEYILTLCPSPWKGEGERAVAVVIQGHYTLPSQFRARLCWAKNLLNSVHIAGEIPRCARDRDEQ